MVNSIKDLFKDITFILMFTVWIILIVASIFSAPQRVSGGEGGYELLPVAIYTHVIIITGLLVLYVFDEPHKLYNLVHLIVGGCLDCIMGILCMLSMGNGHNSRTMIVGILAIAAGVIMIVDFVLILGCSKKE